MTRRWCESGLPAVMAVLRNKGRWDTSNVHLPRRPVIAHDKRRPAPQMRWIDYGLGGLTTGALERVPVLENDLSALYGRLADAGELLGFVARQRFYEIGTPSARGDRRVLHRSGGQVVTGVLYPHPILIQ